MKEIVITTNNLILRDHKVEDLTLHHELISNEEVMYYLDSMRSKDLEMTKEILDLMLDDMKQVNRKKYFLTIIKRDTNEHLGEIGYDVISQMNEFKLINLFFLIDKKYWNNGYATEALEALLQFAFKENDVLKVIASCYEENEYAVKLLKKFGFIITNKVDTILRGVNKVHLEFKLTKPMYFNKTKSIK